MRAIAAAEQAAVIVNTMNRHNQQPKPFVWFCSPLLKGKDMVKFVRVAKENLKGGETK
jgi:hypothetical protein